ncbi:unnamed protein product [Durusdinium trenchii]|uniref:CULT domain-containing protein n=2 Tax=Durusdinium trenchii TaxID=1381693 RepID=A0ABP0QDX2_9DINO
MTWELAASQLLHFDDAGVPRGSCRAYGCDCYQPPVARPITLDGRRPACSNHAAPCHRCGRPAEDHGDLSRWYDAALAWLRRMNTSRKASTGLPAQAQSWEPCAAVLWALSGSAFDLGSQVEEYREERFVGDTKLISVIAVTSQGRHAFHPLLYETFRRQTYEPAELIVVDSGAEPSTYMLERKSEDERVFYYFFKAESSQQPGSPRLQEESAADAMAPALRSDNPMECTEWTRRRPFQTEVKREGWTKGFKRNLACMMTRGSTIVIFEDGCLYAEDYLELMHQELLKAEGSLAAVALQTWHTASLAHQTFRWVDLTERDLQLPEALPLSDKLAHGFTHAFRRAAWLKQPFPDKEGPQDRHFLEALQRQDIKVLLPKQPRDAALAACGWCQQNLSTAQDAATNVNLYSELLILACRGHEESSTPQRLSPLLPFAMSGVEAFTAKSEMRLKQMLEKEGTVYVYGCTFDIGQFSRAGGAVAEGREYDDGTTWFPGWIWRMAICRTCGTHIGWRFESRSWNKSGGRGDASLFWGLIWRHLREHCAAGPQPQTSKRPELRCPKEHPLRRYATPHAHYICDVCNRQVKVGEHLWGCGACDYDMCDGCKAKVIHGAKVEHRESQGLAGLAKTAQKPSQEAPPEAQQALPAIALPLRPEVALWRCHAMYWP